MIAEDMPLVLRPYLSGAALLREGIGRSEAQTYYVARDGGYVLKIASPGALAREAAMTRFLHGHGLAARVMGYASEARDWLLTERLPGESCIGARYLAEPARLCDALAECLLRLHNLPMDGCPFRAQTGHSDDAPTPYDVVLHGDACLPNVLLNDWAFSGFVDLGDGGVGDRHVDVYWVLWSLEYNLKSDAYRERFLDAYGRSFIDDKRLSSLP
jgi:kanamycin kinase